MKKTRTLILSLATVLLLTLGASSASAAFDTTVILTNQNGAVPGSGPYVQVDIHIASTTSATLTYTALSNGGFEYLMGANGSVGANINTNGGSFTAIATGTSYATASGASGFHTGSFTHIGTGNEDGFGSYNLSIDSFDGYTNAWQQVVVTLTGTGTNWTNLASLLTPVSGGAGTSALAAHVFGCTLSGGVCNSGEPVSSTGYVATPEPKLLTALALGMIGLAFFQARRKRSISNN